MNSRLSKILLVASGCLATSAWATSVYPVKLDLTKGKSQAAITGVGNLDNPANGAFARGSLDSDDTVQLRIPISAAIEYGNVDNLFDRLDELSAAYSTSDDGGGGGQGGSSGGESLNIDFNSANPDLDAIIDEISDQASRLAAFTALVAVEGYARAELREEVSLLINKDVLNGTLKLSVSRDRLTSAIGIGDEFQFDADTARQELQAAYNLLPTDPVTTFDLSGGLSLTVDPTRDAINFEFANDSLLLTKAAKKTDVAISYSSLWFENDAGALYWGITPIYRQIGLSNIGIRFGDLVDSEELFEKIDDAELAKDDAFALDAGLFWLSKHYSLGASFYDLLPTTYHFPVLDNNSALNPEIRAELERHSDYETETQLTLEGSVFSEGGRWALSAAVDTRATQDPFRQEFQWASLRADAFWNSWAFSNLNLAVHSNLAGSELTYVSLGADFLKVLSLDIASTLDSTEIDGDELPRGVSLSLGLNFAF